MDVARMNSLLDSRFTETSCSSDTTSSYSIDRCFWAGKTQYGDVVLAKSPVYGKLLFIDNELQSAESDERIYHEYLVHPILNATASIEGKRVLVVGGGEGATVREVLKWSPKLVKEVVWVDIDNELVNLCKQHLGYANGVYEDARVKFHAADIRKYLAENDELYDIIILDLPDPDVEYLTEYGAEEDPVDYELYGPVFWTTLKNKLTGRGQIVTHTGPVNPGKDAKKWRAGLTWIEEKTKMPNSAAYHVSIPSFQGEWGFWMSITPSHMSRFPEGLLVMDGFAQLQAFSWPAYWVR
jgi:spermidine synthase